MKRIRTDIFNIDTIKRAPFAGALLVSEPFLDETYFNHSVVALVEFSPREGALGMVLNNLTAYHMPDILPCVERNSHTESIPVYLGGPVANDRLFYIHTLGPDIISSCDEFAPGLYAGGSFEDVLGYINSGYPTEGKIRFIIGYAGWSCGQLEDELEKGSWAVADIAVRPDDVITGSDDAYWHKILATMVPRYRNWLYYPQNLQSN